MTVPLSTRISAALMLILVAAPIAAARTQAAAEVRRAANAYAEWYSYVLGKPLSATDLTLLQAHAAADYAENAAEVRKATRDVQVLLTRSRRETGANGIGERKRQLTVLYWWLRKAKPADAAEAKRCLSLLDRYNPVLASDSTSGLIVTRRDIESVIASNNFAAKLAGLPQTSRLDKNDAATFQKQFVELPVQTRKYLANGEERHARLLETWPTLTSYRKSVVKKVVKKAAAGGADVASIGRTLESGLIQRVQLIAEARRARRVAATRRYPNGSGRSLGEKMGTFWGMSGALNSFN
ncbi:MAG: hypothetical protein H7Z41_07095 [Cytophagales bacterium]|nr:hypothetical protein [Armatimonadota bacterium]